MVEAKPKKNGSPETKETITLPSWINRLYSVRTAFIGALISIHTASAGMASQFRNAASLRRRCCRV